MTWETQYLQTISNILENGEDRDDRTGTGTRAIFGTNLDIDLRKGFPLVTTKKMATKMIKSELLWFIEGSTDERRLAEIHYGTRDPANKTIWTDNAQAPYWKPKAQFDGDLGNVYGKQWRSWATYKLISAKDSLSHPDGGTTYYGAKVLVDSIDQLAQAIDKIKNNPTDRRIIVNAYNVGELDQMALPPCHTFFQFYVSNKRELSCQLYMRSLDVGLGLPFNIASYAMLTHMVAHVSGCTVGRLIISGGDTHIYRDHIDGLQEQIMRSPLPPPTIWLDPAITSIDDFKMESFKIIDYQYHDKIDLKMAI